MAIGLTPKHFESIPLNDFTNEQFLALAYQSVKNMQWDISYVSNIGLIAYSNNGMFERNYELTIKIENGTANILSKSIGSEIIDWGENKLNVNNFSATLRSLVQQLSTEELDTKYLEIKEQINTSEEDILKMPPPTFADQVLEFMMLFVPRKEFYITPILLDLNIIIFILMAISGANIILPDTEILINWGANFRPYTLDGEWWRLFTCCFIHIGIIHLLMNMYGLMYVGSMLEPLLGNIKYSAAYVLTGIASSVVSLWWHDFTVSAGASGAIFGLYGVFIALLTSDIIEKTLRKQLLTSMAVFVGYNLIFGLKGGIDNAAHIGGLVTGLLVGYSFIPGLKNPSNNLVQYSLVGVLSVFIFVSTFFIYNSLPNDTAEYEAKMTKFESMENMALEVYNLPAGTSDEKYLYEIKDRGIYYWEESYKLLKSVDTLDIPEELRQRNELLKEYCQLRISSYKLLYKAIDEKTDKYQSEIKEYNIQIDNILKKFNGEQ